MEKFLVRNWWKIGGILGGVLVLGMIAFPANTPEGVDVGKRNEDIDACKSVTSLLKQDLYTLEKNVAEKRTESDAQISSPAVYYQVPMMIDASPRVNEMTSKIYSEILAFLGSDFRNQTDKLNSFKYLISSNEIAITGACDHVYSEPKN
jgi:hypothetical protein